MALLAASLLCISLLLQPVTSAYAQEPEQETEETLSGSAANVATDTQEEAEENFDTQEEVEIESIEEVIEEDEVSESADEVEEQEVEEEVEEMVITATTTNTASDSATTASSTSDTTASSSDSVTDDTEEESNESTDGGSSTAGGSGSDNADDAIDTATSTATSTDQTLSDDKEDEQEQSAEAQQDDGEVETSTSTATSTGETVVVSNVQTDNTLAFGKNECTEVADGSFYCQKLSLEDLPEDALFAAPDSTGDMEIFVVQEGIERKVTDNTVDDASPYYDARSETLVWHRLVNDRYQIISYDIDSGEEEQLTDTKVNNMEPTRSGRYTVWQRWVKNNWEIVLFDGEVETQLTDSASHDIAPHVHGDLVIWNVRSSDGSESLMTYNIVSESFNTIADPDGVSVANPRMLVMYEAQYQNGDTVMKGFDLVTGEIVPIERLPRELPDEIPSPETTGEVRALPTNPQTEQEIAVQEEPDSGDDPDVVVDTPDAGDLNLATSSATSTEEGEGVATTTADLDLRPLQLTDIASTSDRIVEQATIPDVIIPAYDPEAAEDLATSTQES